MGQLRLQVKREPNERGKAWNREIGEYMNLFQEGLNEKKNVLTELCQSQVEEVCKKEEEKFLKIKGDVKKFRDILQKDDLVINRFDMFESDGLGKGRRNKRLWR